MLFTILGTEFALKNYNHHCYYTFKKFLEEMSESINLSTNEELLTREQQKNMRCWSHEDAQRWGWGVPTESMKQLISIFLCSQSIFKNSSQLVGHVNRIKVSKQHKTINNLE